MFMKRLHLHENIIYLVLWVMIFLSPVIFMYMRSQSGDDALFLWEEIWRVWKVYAVYLAIFLIHNFLLTPFLLQYKKKALYFVVTFCLLLAFMGYQYIDNSDRRERREEGKEMRADMRRFGPNMAQDDSLKPRDMGDGPRMMPRDGNFNPRESRGDTRMGRRPWGKGPRGDRRFRHEGGIPPFAFPGGPELMSTIFALLMLGMNLGVKLYFRSEKREKDMMLLEQQSLNSQLEYLKYQINPHFFMNTLNNIHALVDIHPELAKTTIVQLSKMMRYVIYDGNRGFVPVEMEHAFLENYVELMRLRYDASKVDMQTNLSRLTECNLLIPPLIVVNFVENAFKHGISYQHESYIHIEVHIEGNRYIFSCHNSKHVGSTDEHGGVGIANTRKRLDLLFGNDYQLVENNNDDVYGIYLDIPLRNEGEN